MKTTAYLLNKKTNKYLLDKNGNHLSVDILEALKLRDDPKRYRDPEYKNKVYMTRNPNPLKRIEVTPRNGKTPHFAFTKSSSSTGDRTYDETYSHEAAVDVLSSMKEMSITADGKKFNLTFSHVYREPQLTLPNGKIFYPDILCQFDKETHPIEYKRWGGKIVIEVTNTHGCEDDKKLEFELCNIPIFEFDITDSRTYPPERDGNRIDSVVERKNHKSRLESWLHDGIKMDLIINPVSTHHHELIYKKLSSEINELNNKYNQRKHHSRELENKINVLLEQKMELSSFNKDIITKNNVLVDNFDVLQKNSYEYKKKSIYKEKQFEQTKMINDAQLSKRNIYILILLSLILILFVERMSLFFGT